MGNEEQEVQPAAPATSVKTFDLSKTSDLINLIREESEEESKRQISSHVEGIFQKHKLTGFRLALLYDEDRNISQFHSDRLYEAVSDVGKKENILLFLVSNGGKIEPAYLISKTCKRLSKTKFVVVAPRRAKSAATPISLGATEIHMGLLSELGPIDPQFSGFPALGLANALEKIASLSEKFPSASEMFAKYLTANLNIKDLGYFERINESAVQYAQRLLDGKSFPDGKSAEYLADHFTNHYKDHNFVIDADEASRLLGRTIVKENSKEYEFSNELYGFLHFADIVYRVFKKKTLRYVGSIQSGIDLNDLQS